MIKRDRAITRTLSLSVLALWAGWMGITSNALAPRENATVRAGSVAFARPVPPPDLKPAAQDDASSDQMEIPERLRVKQQKELRKYRFDQLKEHAAELAKLANSLHEDLEKSNQNILSLQIVDKASKIEKLAKKIQDEAKSGT